MRCNSFDPDSLHYRCYSLLPDGKNVVGVFIPQNVAQSHFDICKGEGLDLATNPENKQYYFNLDYDGYNKAKFRFTDNYQRILWNFKIKQHFEIEIINFQNSRTYLVIDRIEDTGDSFNFYSRRLQNNEPIHVAYLHKQLKELIFVKSNIIEYFGGEFNFNHIMDGFEDIDRAKSTNLTLPPPQLPIYRVKENRIIIWDRTDKYRAPEEKIGSMGNIPKNFRLYLIEKLKIAGEDSVDLGKEEKKFKGVWWKMGYWDGRKLIPGYVLDVFVEPTK